MRKITAITVVGAVVLVSVWIVGSKVAQSRRNSTYQASIAHLQHDLPIGTPKEEVRKYLDSHNMQYNVAWRGGAQLETFRVEVGEDPGSLVCGPTKVYVALDFSEVDALRQIHITRSYTCL